MEGGCWFPELWSGGARAPRPWLLGGLAQRGHQDRFQLRHFRGYRFQLGLKLVGGGQAGVRSRQEGQQFKMLLFEQSKALLERTALSGAAEHGIIIVQFRHPGGGKSNLFSSGSPKATPWFGTQLGSLQAGAAQTGRNFFQYGNIIGGFGVLQFDARSFDARRLRQPVEVGLQEVGNLCPRQERHRDRDGLSAWGLNLQRVRVANLVRFWDHGKPLA